MTLGRSATLGSLCCQALAWPAAARLMLASVLLLLLTDPLSGYAARPAVPKPVSVQGRLVFKDAHVREIWTMVQSGTGTVYRLPAQPLDGTRQPIPPGTFVSLGCTPDAEEPTTCTKITNVEITRSASPVRSTDLTLQLLVMVLSYTADRCAARPGANIDAVRRAYEDDGHAAFLQNCSYGSISYRNITVVATPVPCSTLLNRCDPDAISLAASSYVVNTMGSSFYNSFSRFSYVLPDGIVRTCGWVGLAELPGSQTWFTPDGDGVFNKGTVLQEGVHNFNLYHGWRRGIEYQDNSTSMGYGDSCPSAPELWRLGWATPADTLNSATFPAKATLTYSLPATYMGPEENMIKIQPEWLKSKYKKNVYLALRVKAGADRDLLEEFNGKISVHELNKDIDNFFTARNDPRVTIIGTINPSSTVDVQSYKLVVKTERLENSTMVVSVCRYDASASECIKGQRVAKMALF